MNWLFYLGKAATGVLVAWVLIAICEPNKPCPNKDAPTRLIQADGGVEVDPGQLLDGNTIYQLPNQDDDTKDGDSQ